MSKKRLIFLNLTAQHLLKKYLINEFIKENIQITPAHTGILFSILKEQKPMKELGKILNIKNSTVTGLVDRLETKGFVERVSVPGDRRKWNISITREGEKEINKTKLVINRINQEIMHGHSEEEIDSCVQVLNGMIKKFKE